MERSVRLLNPWRFALGETCPEDNAFQTVTVPHDWAAAGTVSKSAPLGAAQGFFSHTGIGWYSHTLNLPSISPDRRFFLAFDGVWECAEVRVNGTLCARQRYGYTPFRADVTDLLREGENRILVRVDNTREPADRWYSGCGIYRPVRLVETDSVHLEEEQVFITSDILEGVARVRIATGTSEPVRVRLFDPAGHIAAGGEGCGNLLLEVTQPLLWSAENPQLYTAELRLRDDCLRLRLGLRRVDMDAESGLRINGQRVTLRGVCLHQDMGCLGIAATREMWRYRLERLRGIGCNALRLSHHMPSREMLDLCDEMGFYVYEECFDKWHSGLYGRYFDQDWQSDLDAMVLRDRNRPCVLFWGVGNEVENQGQASMVESLRQLTDRVRALDPTRPVTCAMNPHFKRPGKPVDFSKVLDIQALVDEADEQEIEDLPGRLEAMSGIVRHVDVIACNYQEQWFEQIHARFPDKPILATESYPFFMGHPDSMQNYTPDLPALLPGRFPYAIGSMIWTGYDYLGESMGWPGIGWTGSLFRTDGSPRVTAHILQSAWTEEPMVHISVYDQLLGDEDTKAHWACPPFEDVWDFPDLHLGVLPYLIATNCERVELHSGGRVFHPRTERPFFMGFVPWVPGRVEVRGFRNGVCVCTAHLDTPESPAELSLEAFSGRTPAPGEEILLTASLRDVQHTLCIREKRPVTFACEGDAEILATDNGNLMDHTPFPSPCRSTWHGSVSCAVRRTGPGAGRVFARCGGFEGTFAWDKEEKA